MKYQNLMIDIETLGNKPGCAILSIGAIPFEMDNISEETFYSVINLESCTLAGLEIQPDLLIWWLGEDSKLLEKYLTSPLSEPLYDSIDKLDKFIKQNCNPGFHAWSRGAKFDLPILEYAARTQGFNNLIPPMKERCARTYMALDPELNQKPQERHDPLIDCMSQIRSIQAIHNKYFNGK